MPVSRVCVVNVHMQIYKQGVISKMVCFPNANLLSLISCCLIVLRCLISFSLICMYVIKVEYKIEERKSDLSS